MFLLVTGASGAGKSTARRAVAQQLSPEVACIELHDLVSIPRLPNIAWRQQATEQVVQRALELQAQGRHLMLSGDPVAAGEVIATPSAVGLEGVAVCLLDVDRSTQAGRLSARGDDPRLLADHQAFADWMREHARDPRHMPHVLSNGGWEAMDWERCTRLERGWGTHVVDTSSRSTDEVAAAVVDWCRRALTGRAPVMRVPI
jgi:energy-coupling factor transporter ATP-binding protein EcfA2